MKFKLFGREIFRHNSGETLILNARNELKEDKFLPDFFNNNTLSGLMDFEPVNYLSYSGSMDSSTTTNPATTIVKVSEKREEGKIPKKEYSPKTIFKLHLLNEKDFKINTDPDYVDKQVEILKDKLSLIQSSKYDMGNGVKEVASILIRMENRKKYSKFEKFYSEYAYTTNKKIASVIKKHSYLKIDKVEQFLADMPEDAIKSMTEYKIKTKSLCDKLPIFYIIANKKDFQKTDKRKDPILLAQSPFGHFWSILGAWDEEMILLDEL